MPDYLLEKALFSKDIDVTKEQFCYSKKVQSTINFSEREAHEKMQNHLLFAISPESSVCCFISNRYVYPVIYSKTL